LARNINPVAIGVDLCLGIVRHSSCGGKSWGDVYVGVELLRSNLEVEPTLPRVLNLGTIIS
jgi:hypothetical protein